MSTVLKDGSTVEDPRLGRLKEFDERSRNFAVSRLLSATQLQKPRTYTWQCNTWLNQLQEGSCTWHAIGHELAARPIVVPNITHEFAQKGYWQAQREDPWPGGSWAGATPFYEGTSVLSAIKVAQEWGFYTGYSWAFSEEEMMLAISWKGPVVIGVNWMDSMYEPDSKGYIRPTGNIAGGHCIMVNGFSLKSQSYRLRNSWGQDWGVNGDCFMNRDDMKTLLAADGEVAVPEGRMVGPSTR